MMKFGVQHDQVVTQSLHLTILHLWSCSVDTKYNCKPSTVNILYLFSLQPELVAVKDSMAMLGTALGY